MLIHTKTLALPDHRTLTYAEYGDPAGYPLIWLHGNPSCRREPELFDPALLARLHIRAIVPDRPGIGQSDFKPARRLLDWPTDLAALAAALKLERFALLALSAGAPYLAACARAMPHRITRAGIVSGLGPWEAQEPADLRSPGLRYFATARRSPWLSRGAIWRMRQGMHQPEKWMARFTADLPPADQVVLAEPRVRQSFLALLHEAWRKGGRGLAWDAALVSRPWGFAPEEISLPIYLWHGDADRNAPLAMGVQLAAALRNSHLQVVPGEGHFSLAVRHLEVILRTLIVPHDYRVGR
jgi:pimeloyl-ACP methyl ester carboxylesterase